MLNFVDSFAAHLFRHQIRGARHFHRTFYGGRRLAVRSTHGILLKLDPSEYVDSMVIRYGFYEEEVLLAVLGRLKLNDVFWDVGSNIGLHALTVAHLRPDARTIAFEPNPELTVLIRSVATHNELTVNVEPIALDSHSGTADLYLHRGNCGRSSLHNWDLNPNLDIVTVTTSSGTELVKSGRLELPNVIKIDVEGHEAQVIEGLAELLPDSGLHTIVFEDCPDKESPTKQMLYRAGFAIRTLKRLEPTEHDLVNFIAER
jgi:FkbM family methyltransferase